jgi:SAM-dependent methyltransferase
VTAEGSHSGLVRAPAKRLPWVTGVEGSNPSPSASRNCAMAKAGYWDEIWSNHPLRSANSFARRTYRLIEARNLRTLLDLGSADGRDSLYFHKKGLQVTAADHSETAIRKLRERNPDINCLLTDIRDLNLRENSFDVVYTYLSLHYFDDETTRRIFDNLHGIMKKGGLFLAKVKSVDDRLFGKGERVGENMYRTGHTRHFFSREYMLELLERYRYEVIRVRKTSSSYHGYKSSFIEAVATK